VALVGTRKPTPDGLFLADFASACLHDMRTATVSGLAEGIDTRVHAQSLRFKIPTIAVLGTGVLQDFPRGSRELRHRSSAAAAPGALPAESAERVPEVEAWLGATSGANLAAELEGLASAADLTARVNPLDVPVLVRVGAEDAACPAAKSKG
jgi:hypothetical protein